MLFCNFFIFFLLLIAEQQTIFIFYLNVYKLIIELDSYFKYYRN